MGCSGMRTNYAEQLNDGITITSTYGHATPMRRPQAAGGGGGRELELLKGITGAFRPGVLTALMGAPKTKSICGKQDVVAEFTQHEMLRAQGNILSFATDGTLLRDQRS